MNLFGLPILRCKELVDSFNSSLFHGSRVKTDSLRNARSTRLVPLLFDLIEQDAECRHDLLEALSVFDVVI